MRVAVKIAYDGRAFYGHQRQPVHRTVEGECLTALKSAKILRSPQEAFFRSASRTDRGVSAVGNVIAFNTILRPDAVVGAFNDQSRDVWAWALAVVPETFHPRHAVERWYRYHLREAADIETLREAAAEFEGEHDVQSFTSDPPERPLTIHRIDIAKEGDVTCIDVRAPSFRRGMVRRIVAAMLSCAEGEVSLEDIRTALRGAKKDFGTTPPEPLVLMDVRYDFEFQTILKPKVRDEWRAMTDDLELRQRFLGYLWRAVKAESTRENL